MLTTFAVLRIVTSVLRSPTLVTVVLSSIVGVGLTSPPPPIGVPLSWSCLSAGLFILLVLLGGVRFANGCFWLKLLNQGLHVGGRAMALMGDGDGATLERWVQARYG